MPHEWKNGVIVVTREELVPSFYNSEGHLKTEIARYRDQNHGIKKVQRAGNGRPMLISFDSLPREMQEALGDPRKHLHILERYYRVDDAAVRFYGKHEFADGGYLAFAHQEQYITNASVLQAVGRLKTDRIIERQSKGGSLKGLLTSLWSDCTGFNPTLQKRHGITHTLPASEKRFKETFKDFFKDPAAPDYRLLISGKLKNDNARLVTDEVLELLNALFAGTIAKPTRTEISKQYDAFLGGYIEVVKADGSGECYDPKGFKKLSDATIINYLGAWEHEIGSHKVRSGDSQKLRNKFIPHFSFAKPAYGGSLISVDDREAPFHYAKGLRPVFYLGVDGASGAFTFCVHGTEKKGIMLQAYQQMVRNYTEWGLCLPGEIECEVNGNSPFKNTLLRDGVMCDKVRMIPNNARAKMVERFIGYLRYDEQSEKGRLGWIARPFARNEANQAGPLQGKAETIVPYEQIVTDCLHDMEIHNNTEHPDYPGVTRWEVFKNTQHPALKPTNWNILLPHLGHSEPTSVNAGMVILQGKKWLLGTAGEMATGERLINLMKLCESKEVTAYWLDGNDGKVLKAIIVRNDTVICELVAVPRPQRADIEKTYEDRRLYTEMAKYVSTIEAYQKKQAGAIEKVLLIDNRKRTLNDGFKMPGLARPYTPPEEDAQILPAAPEEDFFLPPPVAGGQRRTLIDTL